MKAWLVSESGPQAGLRYSLSQEVIRIGRALENDVVLQGPDALSVSLRHAEIQRKGESFILRDLDSTNGTFLNGERITEAELRSSAHIRLGTQGPEFVFALDGDLPAETETGKSVNLESTQVIRESDIPAVRSPDPAAPPPTIEGMLTDAVVRAREARKRGWHGDNTMVIMRDALQRALRHTGRRSRLIIIGLAIGLFAVSGLAAWKVTQLSREKRVVDGRIQEIEAKLAQTPTAEEADRLLAELDVYQTEGERLRRNLLYRVGVREQDFVTEEIRELMAEFGSEVYSVPSDFTERVNHYIEEYRGPNRENMARALGSASHHVKRMRTVLESEQLPPDLAFVPVVESALGSGQSSAGAAGWWQFTAATARAYGLKVDGEVDERTDTVKSTRAACRYLRELILDFGAGSSVMLALAAYNVGPSKVKQAVMKTVRDPIRQRNFWYLYRIRALPAETREYVPKVVAAMIIGRNADRFGFPDALQ